MDRTREQLGRANLGIIRVRKCLLDVAVALRECGTPPPGMAPASFLIRPVSVILPKDVPCVEGAKEHLGAVTPTQLQGAW